jgi:hypothetical protein
MSPNLNYGLIKTKLMKRTRMITMLPIILGLLVSPACNKTNDNENLYDTSEDISDVQEMYDDLTVQADLYEQGDKTACPIVTVTRPDTAAFPKHIVIDFGTGCENQNGRVRAGKIIIDQTGYMNEEGSMRTISLDSFYINDFHIEGTRTVSCTGRNADQFLSYSVVLTGGTVTLPDGRTVTHESNRTRVWIQGEETPLNVYDDVYRITGTGSGINRFGNAYETETVEPVLFDMSCNYRLVQGIIRITTDSHTVLLDYGDGSCDNIVTVTVDGGEPKDITFHKR